MTTSEKTAGRRSVTRFDCLLLVFFCCAAAPGLELPAFESDAQADGWLRARSPAYRGMAEAVDRSGGYTIGRTAEMPGGVAYFKDGRGYLEMNDALKGAHRVSVMIFELTNLYQEPRHGEVTDRVRRGELNDATVFALWRESIEYDGLRLHRDVLRELQPILGTVPPEMITWASSNARSFDEYQLPYAYDYLTAQAAGGHTAHYLRLFEKHRAEFLEAAPKGKGDPGMGDARNGK
jgi:hypothetical protein